MMPPEGAGSLREESRLQGAEERGHGGSMEEQEESPPSAAGPSPLLGSRGEGLRSQGVVGGGQESRPLGAWTHSG